MQCTVPRAAGMYLQLSKIGPPTKILILDTCHADTLYLREQECEDFRSQNESASKTVW